MKKNLYEVSKKVVDVLRSHKYSTSMIDIFTSVEYALSKISKDAYDFHVNELSEAMERVEYIWLKADYEVNKDALAYIALTEIMIQSWLDEDYSLTKWKFLEEEENVSFNDYNNKSELADYLKEFYQRTIVVPF